MNLKVSLYPILTLGLLIGLSACANRNQQAVEVVADAEPSIVKSVENEAEEKLSLIDIEPLELKPEQSRPAGVLERIRQGFQLPKLESQHVAQFEKWSTEHETYLDGLFLRGTPFLYHIVEEIEKRELPMELALLPAIESAFRPTAVSRSRADGLWQFIPSTGREFGLRQDWWYDGRRDALSSTTAALDYLTQLNQMFDGDWFLALAAYNAGPGTVSRAIRTNRARGRGTKYQDLNLRRETKRYIPKLIALRNVINDPQAFGIELPYIESEPYFEIVTLKGQIDIKKFAKEAGIELADLRHLNAGFKRWATSPKGPHRLLIPINENGDISHAELAAQTAPEINYSNHKIAQGDSLSTIAKRYGVSVSALKTSNNLHNSRIRAGKDLLIPVRDVPLVTTQKTISDLSKGNNQQLKSNAQFIHQVKSGDTLWSIARQYKVNMNKLLSWNNISKNQILQLNQTLLVMKN